MSVQYSIAVVQSIDYTLPWLTCQIRNVKKLKSYLTEPNNYKPQKHGLTTYHSLRNEINNEIKHGQESFQNNLFDVEKANKNFWKYITALRKDNTGISLLRLICHSIIKHFGDNHILSNFQYGFRPAHSCESQLITPIVKKSIMHWIVNTKYSLLC